MLPIIITGANGNLGTACVKALLDRDFPVIATDRAADHLSELSANPGFSFTAVDLANEMATREFIATQVKLHGNIGGAVLLAGGFSTGNLAHTGIEDIRHMLTLNFETAYTIARPLLDQFLTQNYGRLVFIGARPAIEPEQGKDLLAYALSKSLLFSLAENINAATKGKNITATVVVPSIIDTPLNRKSMPGADPGNWVTPGALARIIAFIIAEPDGVLRETVLKAYHNA
jgi:NADP-dependent 3-hydroxy acid dehydrogenase YdfG